MHDILEGVAQYELKLLLEYLSEFFFGQNLICCPEFMPLTIDMWNAKTDISDELGQ